MSILIYIMSIILIFIIVTYLYDYVGVPLKEMFADLNIYNPLLIKNECSELHPDQCIHYSNCGVCDGKCLQGDAYGPFFNSTCKNWSYKDNDMLNIENDIITSTPLTYDNFMPYTRPTPLSMAVL